MSDSQQATAPAADPSLDPVPETTTIVSPNRPLTRNARDALKPYGIRSRDDPQEPGRQTVVELERRPPTSLREQHELTVDEPPVAAFDTGQETVRIFPDRVLAGAVEASLDPADALEQAEQRDDWDQTEDNT